MSHHLLALPAVAGALQTALLLALVWWAWVYTTWATNYLDARRIPVRLILAPETGQNVEVVPADTGSEFARGDPGGPGAGRRGGRKYLINVD